MSVGCDRCNTMASCKLTGHECAVRAATDAVLIGNAVDTVVQIGSPDDDVARLATGESFTTTREGIRASVLAYESRYGCLECGQASPAHDATCLAGALGGAAEVMAR